MTAASTWPTWPTFSDCPTLMESVTCPRSSASGRLITHTAVGPDSVRPSANVRAALPVPLNDTAETSQCVAAAIDARLIIPAVSLRNELKEVAHPVHSEEDFIETRKATTPSGLRSSPNTRSSAPPPPHSLRSAPPPPLAAPAPVVAAAAAESKAQAAKLERTKLLVRPRMTTASLLAVGFGGTVLLFVVIGATTHIAEDLGARIRVWLGSGEEQPIPAAVADSKPTALPQNTQKPPPK